MITKETINLLKQINYINKEIDDLTKRISRIPLEEVGDSVQASSTMFPYTEVTVKIQGYEENNKRKEYKKILNENKLHLFDLLIELEKELNKIGDSRIRLIIRYRYIDKMKWNKIARELNTTADAVRMELKRFLKEK